MRAPIAIVLAVLSISAYAGAGDAAGPGPAGADALMAKPAFGWFDVCGRAKYDARQRDVRADWSPTPDCNGE